jgi:hypothetical protein
MSSLVSSLEAARKQQELNDTLRRSILDADALAKKVHASASTSANRSAAARHNKRGVEQLAEYEKIATMKATRRFNAAGFLRECNQTVGMEQLVTGKDKCDLAGLTRAGNSIERLRKQQQGGGPLALFGDHACAALSKAEALVKETSLDTAEWGSLPDALVVLMDEVSALTSTEALLAEQKETIKRMHFEIDDLSQRQEDAIAEGDMKQMEVLYFKKITVQEMMVGVFNNMYTALDGFYQEAFVDPLKRVHGVHTQCNASVSQLMHKNDALKGQLEADIGRLDAMHKALNDESGDVKQLYLKRREESDGFLANNMMQTEQCYSAMEEIEKQLGKLAAERTQALELRVAAVDAEDARVADLSNFNQFFKQHKQLLDATVQTVEVSEEVTDLIDELLCNGCNAVEQRVREIDAEVEAERMKIHDERLEHFRTLYLTIGDLQYKKERNLEELDKKIEHTHIQQELAMDTFNPKAKEYSDTKKNLQNIRSEMEGQVSVLSDKAVLHIEAFKPTEAALLEAGRSFVHPADELVNKNRQREQKLLEYHQLMSSAEEAGAAPLMLENGGGARSQ